MSPPGSPIRTGRRRRIGFTDPVSTEFYGGITLNSGTLMVMSLCENVGLVRKLRTIWLGRIDICVGTERKWVGNHGAAPTDSHCSAGLPFVPYLPCNTPRRARTCVARLLTCA